MKRFKLFLKMLYLGILGLLSFVLLSCGAFLLFLRTQYMLPVLTYHRVVPWAHKHGPLLVSPESFRRQMSFFQRNHYHVLSLREAAPYIASSRFPPPRSVVITFDDGYDDNFIYAFPILKKYGFPATIFMVAGEVGKPNFLNWEQLREMTYHGIAIGSHTITHCYLPRESRERMREEIFNSKKILEDELGGEVVSFCYPVGGFNECAKGLVKEAGYRCAVTTNPDPRYPDNDTFAITRIRVSHSSDNLWVFWLKSSGLYSWLRERKDDH